jgi:peptidoglycan hydrolase-like protein with peptidoglycan-binding domain
VKKLQEALNIDADGIFGGGTEAALKDWQRSQGLNPDGIAGKNTYKKLGLIS